VYVDGLVWTRTWSMSADTAGPGRRRRALPGGRRATQCHAPGTAATTGTTTTTRRPPSVYGIHPAEAPGGPTAVQPNVARHGWEHWQDRCTYVHIYVRICGAEIPIAHPLPIAPGAAGSLHQKLVEVKFQPAKITPQLKIKTLDTNNGPYKQKNEK
jgi:hypothetical protein